MNESFLRIRCFSWGDTVWCALWPNTDLLYVGNKCASFESPLPVHWAEWVQIGRWSSRSGFSESVNNKCVGSNKGFSPGWLSWSHLLCNIPDIKMSLNQWRTGGGWRERAQCRRGRVSHEWRRHLGELKKKPHTSTHRNTITTNHAWRKRHRSVRDEREADERHQQTIIARTTQTCIQRISHQFIGHLSTITEPIMEYCDRNNHYLRAPWWLSC